MALESVKSYANERALSNPPLYALTLDLDDLSSVKSFPERYKGTVGLNIDVLLNNAGVAAIPTRELTKDGFERTFQSNYLGPFALTALLFPYLNRDGYRVINVSSIAHTFVTDLDLDNLNSEINYQGWQTYGRTKLENILFTQELQRRADRLGLDCLSVVSLHSRVKMFYSNVLSVEEGANTQVMLAAAGEVGPVKGL